MRVTLLNASDSGGAGNAVKRIHKGLRRIGVDSSVLVDHGGDEARDIVGRYGKLPTAYAMARSLIDRAPLALYGGAEGVFSPAWLPDDLPQRIARYDPDVIHFNWMGRGFLDVSSVAKMDAPIVWTLHDMWPFTGGCHYAGECKGYESSCGSCPRLGSSLSLDLSKVTLWRKRRAFQDADITLVSPSHWLAEQAAESSLLGNRRIEVIPNALDTEIYRPWDRSFARRLFDLPEDARIVLFGAESAGSNPRKGFDLLCEALRDLSERGALEDLQLVVFGNQLPDLPNDLSANVRYLGYLPGDRTLALCYAAADAMVVPSRQEAFGQTASESLACGTPVATFDATGLRDIVDHKENGYLAEPYDPADLARGIQYILSDGERRVDLSETARKKAKQTYALDTVAEQYRTVYESVTDKHKFEK
jgi:glycosyltransferase involved in cell wall biosynthesis